MFKRILSVLLTVLMTLSLIMVPAMGVSASEFETIDIADYVPGEKPASLALSNFGGNSVCGFTTTRDKENGVYVGTYTVAAPETADFTGTNAGYQSSIAMPSVGFWATYGATAFVKDKTYVLSFKVKNTNPEVPTKVVYGLVDGSMGGGQQNYAWKGQWVYTEDVTSSEWKTINKTISINLNSTASTQLQIGLGMGNTHNSYKNNAELALVPNSVLTVNNNSVYIAEEIVYDVENTLSATKVLPGATVTGNAKVINQLGEKSGLDQTMTYFVTDKSGVVAEGFTVTKGENGDYTVAVGDSVEEGDYIVLARSSAYNTDKTENLLQAPVALTVKDEDYSDTEDLDTQQPIVMGATGCDSTLFADYGVTTGVETENIYRLTASEAAQTKIPASIDAPCGGLAWKLEKDGITQGTKYIITFKVKKNSNSKEDKLPNLVYGLVDGSMGVGWGWKAQTVCTMDVDSSDWQTVVTEVTPPTDASVNVRFVLGLGVGSTRTEYAGKAAFELRDGASILVDLDSICVVKDDVKGLTNTALTSTQVLAGDKIEAKATVVNTAGFAGNLDQTMEYLVLDAATRKKPASGITVTAGENGNYTVNVSKSVAAGDYVVVATNTTNGAIMRKGLEFIVNTIDKYAVDHVPGGKPVKLFAALSGTSNTTTFDANGITENRVDGSITNTDFDFSAFKHAYAAWGGLHGYRLDIPAADSSSYSVRKGDTYVVEYKIKNTSDEGITPKFGATLASAQDTYGPLAITLAMEEVTERDDYQTFKFALTAKADSGLGKTSRINIGMPWGNTQYFDAADHGLLTKVENAKINIDYKSIYIAKEAFHDVAVKADNQAVWSGGSIVVDAAALNQIGIEGGLEQSFSWVALNASKTDVAEGITITPVDGDSSKVNVAFDKDIAQGTYAIAAYSEEYDAAKSIAVTVSNKVSVENIALDTATGKVTFDALNVPEGGLNVRVYIAQYSSNGTKLEKLAVAPVSLSEGDNTGVEATYTESFSEDNLIKIFVWKSDLSPLAEVVEAKKN